MLKLIGPNGVAPTGSAETITIAPANNAPIQLNSAFYCGAPLAVAADGLSVGFTVADGLNNIVFNFVAPDFQRHHYTILSGTLPLRYGTVADGAGNCAVPILGQAAAAASTT